MLTCGPLVFPSHVQLTCVGEIVFAGGLAPILRAAPVVYTGPQSLRIAGNGTTLDGGGMLIPRRSALGCRVVTAW